MPKKGEIMDFNSDWRKCETKGEGVYIHKNEIVGTFNYTQTGGSGYKYIENKGKLRSLIDYCPDKKLTLAKVRDAILKCGGSYYNFNAMYDAVKSIGDGKVNLKDILLKEQINTESITAFCYQDLWFCIAPVINTDKEKERKILEPQW